MSERNVKFLELNNYWQRNWSKLEPIVHRFLTDEVFIGGEKLIEFEAEFSKWSQAKFTFGVSNGLDALKIALKAANIQPGDEVIVPTNTFIATWLAASDLGCSLVLVEPSWNTHVLSVDQIARSMTSKTKCVIYVTLYGNSDNLFDVQDLCQRNNVALIIDAAQSHGTKIEGRGLGCFGDAVCYSFYPGKTLGAVGDAGAITTNNDDIARNISLLRNYGSEKKYYHEIKGYNSRLDPLQAIFLKHKLRDIDEEIAVRSSQMREYTKRLPQYSVEMVAELDCADVSWHLAAGRFSQRDLLKDFLAKNGIETVIHYPVPAHMQKAYSDLKIGANLGATEHNALMLLSLPLGSHVSDADLNYVIDAICSFY
jgi:dTDP-4-amino-4,6-dideoxygalactose transaminase